MLDKHKGDINKLCLDHNVGKLFAFGSLLTNSFGNDSDLDLIVDFNDIAITQYADSYYDLKFSLQQVLQRSIDLLENKAIKNSFFRESLHQKIQLIYGH